MRMWDFRRLQMIIFIILHLNDAFPTRLTRLKSSHLSVFKLWSNRGEGSFLELEEDSSKGNSRPPIIPFDFAREDVPDAKVQAIVSELEREKAKKPNPFSSSDRPTGYANDISMEDDSDIIDRSPDVPPAGSDDEDWVPTNDRSAMKMLQDIYIVPLDS